ncbi:MAG: ABC transporter ATP-binding protein [Candidatus Eisenbacteria bacterium]|nr:ABC transporter ATP-binding protein [Candidatus Eisenbacteria bacterium]
MNEFLRLFRYVLPWWRKGIAALLCTFLFALFSGVTVGMILPFTKILFEGKLDEAEIAAAPAGDTPLSAPVLDAWKARGRDVFLGLFADDEPERALFKVCVGIFLVFMLKGTFNYLQQILMITLQERTIKSIRDDLYRRTTFLPLAFFERTRTGELISRITNDVTLVKDMVSVLFTQAIQNVMLLLVYVAVAAVVSWRLALLSFIIFPLLGLFTSKVSRKLRKYSTRFQEDMARITSSLQETITGIRIVKAFATEEYEGARFRGYTGDYFNSFLRFRRFAVLASPVAEQLGVVGSVIVLWYGGRQVIAGAGLGPEGFFLFLAAVLNMMQPIRKLSHTNTVVQQGISAATRIFQLLDTPPEPRPEEGRRAAAVRESILYDHVSFLYDGSDGAPALRDVTLEIPSGAMVALVGPSGAGKSTLADLLPRFHDPTEGRILLDGVDLRTFDLASLRGIMGIVTQETILFNETIGDNIAYGRADIPRTRIEEAARAANAADFIERLPEGYDTVVGDRGVRLSGGERQRLAIARAILQNPPILILDEATSSLDAESEALVQDAVEKLVRDRTTLVIAHRLSTILRAHRIAVLERGRLIQQGTHGALLREGGVYRKLFDMQFRSESGGTV